MSECDDTCVTDLREQIFSLSRQLSVYKPVLLSLVTALVCISAWLAVLTLTGKRRDKLRRLLRRDQFVSELEAGDQGTDGASSQDVGSVAASVEDVSELAPAQQPRRGSQLSQRSGKISLPAKISDLYQPSPGDGEGMVQVPAPAI